MNVQSYRNWLSLLNPTNKFKEIQLENLKKNIALLFRKFI